VSESSTRLYLRRELEAHLTKLGYTTSRARRLGQPAAEVVRMSPVRGRLAYGETVLHADLSSPRSRDRLVFFSQRRTRHRSSILFFIAVFEADREALELLLAELGVRNSVRGGHVHVLSIAAPESSSQSVQPATPRGARDAQRRRVLS